MFYQPKLQEDQEDRSEMPPLCMYIDLDSILVEDRFPVAETTDPIMDSEATLTFLAQYADIYMISNAPWSSYRSWCRMTEWVKAHCGDSVCRHMIFTDHKELLKGDYLVTSSYDQGSYDFEGKLILLGSEDFPDWFFIDEYLRKMVLYDRRGYNHERPKAYPDQMLIEALKYTGHNEDSIRRSRVCGCIHCGHIFDPRIEPNLSYAESGAADTPGSLCCPRCGYTTVIGSASGYPAGDRRFLVQCGKLEHRGTNAGF